MPAGGSRADSRSGSRWRTFASLLFCRAPARRLEVDTVGDEQQTIRPSAEIVDAVLPDDLVRPWIDDDHPVAEVVVQCDQPVAEFDRERGVVKHSRAGPGRIAPDGLPLRRHDQDLPGAGLVDPQDAPVREPLTLRRRIYPP